MKKFILDASVGIKWLFKEELSDKAIRFLELIEKKEIEVFIPDFFYLEISNICWIKYKQKMASLDEIETGIDKIMELSLQSYPDYELADVALENSCRFGISAYDGAYLALSELYVAPLITADEALLRACRKKFDFIESLRDF